MDYAQYMIVRNEKGTWQARVMLRLGLDGRVYVKDGDRFVEIETNKRFISYSGELSTLSKKEGEE